VRFALRLVPSTLTDRIIRAMQTVTLESSTEFGFGNVRHYHQRDKQHVKAKRRVKDNIAILNDLLGQAIYNANSIAPATTSQHRQTELCCRLTN